MKNAALYTTIFLLLIKNSLISGAELKNISNTESTGVHSLPVVSYPITLAEYYKIFNVQTNTSKKSNMEQTIINKLTNSANESMDEIFRNDLAKRKEAGEKFNEFMKSLKTLANNLKERNIDEYLVNSEIKKMETAANQFIDTTLQINEKEDAKKLFQDSVTKLKKMAKGPIEIEAIQKKTVSNSSRTKPGEYTNTKIRVVNPMVAEIQQIVFDEYREWMNKIQSLKTENEKTKKNIKK